MTRLIAVSTYRPCYAIDGKRVPGPDEDVVTMAVSAASATPGDHHPDRVILVSRQIHHVPNFADAVIAAALRLPDSVPVERRLGGAATALEALTQTQDHTLVICVDMADGGGAAAALTEPGEGLRAAGRVRRGMPVSDLVAAQGDLRFVRDRAWRPVARRLAAGTDGKIGIAGLPAQVARTLLPSSLAVLPAPVEGAPAALAVLAEMATADLPARVVAFDGADAAAADLLELGFEVVRVERRSTVVYPKPPSLNLEIPISLSAFERAFDAKVGLKAACCECGEMSLPPRRICLRCGRMDAAKLVSLPHKAEVYSVVTVHAPIPGKRVPYTLAVVTVDGVAIRVLAPVTDVEPGTTRIGDQGELVLRRIAEREGIADYGYAFQPSELSA